MKLHSDYSNILQFRIFESYPSIVHFSTTRQGGVSKGEYASFNLGNFSDDDPVKIFENRTQLARMFYKDVDKLIVPHQTHGTRVVEIERTFLQSDKHTQNEILYNCDATITREKGIFICATTADCVPILLFDPKNEAIAAIHAGWRGTVGRIVEKTITIMREKWGTHPSDLIAAIGPAIAIKNFEVGDEVVKAFQENRFELTERVARKFPPSKRLFLDLKEINRQELVRLGVPKNQIEKTRYNTFTNKRLFFSARRQSVHCGRMLTGIMME